MNGITTNNTGNCSMLNKPFEWTDIHSHFLQMGGYIFRFEQECRYVGIEYLFPPRSSPSSPPVPIGGMNIAAMRKALIDRKDSEEQLMDRSKTNIISKTIVFGQMLWFTANLVGGGGEPDSHQDRGSYIELCRLDGGNVHLLDGEAIGCGNSYYR